MSISIREISNALPHAREFDFESVGGDVSSYDARALSIPNPEAISVGSTEPLSTCEGTAFNTVRSKGVANSSLRSPGFQIGFLENVVCSLLAFRHNPSHLQAVVNKGPTLSTNYQRDAPE